MSASTDAHDALGVMLADNVYSDPDDTSIIGSSGTMIIIAR